MQTSSNKNSRQPYRPAYRYPERASKNEDKITEQDRSIASYSRPALQDT